MEKKIYQMAILALLVMAFASFGAYAQDLNTKNESPSCNRTDLVGALVRNPNGNLIGVVDEVKDADGQSFAIIDHGPETVFGEADYATPVPVAALKISESRSEQSDQPATVILDKTEKQLEAAPSWDPDKMANRLYEARIDDFYGIQPTYCG